MEYENLELKYCPVGLVAGVDEVGRGPLAGDVVAAAVILDPKHPIVGLADSKKLSEKKREQLFDEIKKYALAYSVHRASVEEIDRINILQASLLAMKRAVLSLGVTPDFALIDGNKTPTGLPCNTATVIKGDSRVRAISAASILAKVTRDREMQTLDYVYPGYGLAQHKGYPTAAHLSALKILGASKIHRKSFKPVRDVLNLDPIQVPLL